MPRLNIDKPLINLLTRQEAVVDSIRKMILCGELLPGQHLVQDDLARQFGVSRTPIREALTRLAHEGLVSMSSYKGASVTQFSSQDLVNIYSVRAALESYATYLAALRFGDEQVAQLEGLMAEMNQAFHQNDFERLVTTHEQFHLAIYAAAQTQLLYNLIVNYLGLSSVYQRLALSMGRGAKDPIKEHQDILEMLRYQEADAACGLIRSHLQDTMSELLEILNQR